jgi:hypothetical protein
MSEMDFEAGFVAGMVVMLAAFWAGGVIGRSLARWADRRDNAAAASKAGFKNDSYAFVQVFDDQGPNTYRFWGNTIISDDQITSEPPSAAQDPAPSDPTDA